MWFASGVPQLTRTYPAGWLTPEQLRSAYEAFDRQTNNDVPGRRQLRVLRDGETWEFEESDEFLAELSDDAHAVEVVLEWEVDAFTISHSLGGTTITIRLGSRSQIDSIVGVLPAPAADGVQELAAAFTVFLGHGRSPQWLVLADHLRRVQGVDVVTYESTARVGEPAMSVLERLTGRCAFAILVHTAEVAGTDGTLHAGPNVIHETGLFQARLGADRALILREATCHAFSNVAGLTERRFGEGQIQQVFGDVTAILRDAARSPLTPTGTRVPDC
jgi:hypothetical protein